MQRESMWLDKCEFFLGLLGLKVVALCTDIIMISRIFVYMTDVSNY